MRIQNLQRILNSPTSLSFPVLLLQFPLALILAFSNRTLWDSRHPLFRVDLAIGQVIGVALCFALGNLALRLAPALQSRRPLVTLTAWLLIGLQSKPTADALQHFLGGQHTAFGWRTLLIPVTWFASLASVTHVLQSRSEFKDTYERLQRTAATLSDLDKSSQQELDAERRQLIETVQQTIQPELQHIASEIRELGNQGTADGFRNLLQQVDNYSVHTVRRLIDELFAETSTSKVSPPRAQASKRPPRLKLRSLTLNPQGTFWIAFSVSMAATLPSSTFHQQMAMVAQVVVMLSPVVVLNRMQGWHVLAQRIQPVVWVIVACLSVMALRLSLPNESPLLVLHNPPPAMALLMAALYALSILLGSLNKYFVDSYVAATHEQAQVNAQLALSVEKNESARQVVRRNVGRIMHGPIQGRLAAIRLKLHILSETSSNGELFLDAVDSTHILDLLAQISHEIDNLGDESGAPAIQSMDEALNALASKWRGIMRVSFDISSEAQAALVLARDLAQKLLAAASEAITNASRHGYATQADLSVKLTAGGNLELTVVDDGSGVEQPFTAGIGLQDIEGDGGIWRFEPCDTGAKLCIDFPLQFAIAT